ncbi:hypothetical protein DRY87_25565, partial [Salmonella enterica subsp. enterica serovar Newport]|nr:hypothetical protein [Salmonella enterica subsp. enterica serovar Newport]
RRGERRGGPCDKREDGRRDDICGDCDESATVCHVMSLWPQDTPQGGRNSDRNWADRWQSRAFFPAPTCLTLR